MTEPPFLKMGPGRRKDALKSIGIRKEDEEEDEDAREEQQRRINDPEMRDREYHKAMEAFLFTFERKDEMDFFEEECRDRLDLRINVSTITAHGDSDQSEDDPPEITVMVSSPFGLVL